MSDQSDLLIKLETIVEGLSDEVKGVTGQFNEHTKMINQLQIDMAVQKVKAGLWGGILGFASGFGGMLLILLKEYLKK